MTDDKILAAAKKAARRMARATGTPYQTCLDIVARKAGRANWSAFLADPVDVTPRTAGGAPASTVADDDAASPVANDDAAATIVQPAASSIGRDHRHVQEDPAPTTLTSRIVRMLVGAERGIVRRSVDRWMLHRRKDYGRGEGMPLGRSVENGYDLVVNETLPVLVLAPPGTGKTASVVVPTIIGSDRHSLVIHDEVGLSEMTSGHRATIGPVTILDLQRMRSIGSLNPLSSAWIPRERAARASYVAALAQAITLGDRPAHDVMVRAINNLTGTDGGTTFQALSRALSDDGGAPAMSAGILLSPFLDPAVTACTTADGFYPEDLRGSRDETGRQRPTTLYIVRGYAGNERQGIVAAAIQAAVWWWTLSATPGERSADGAITGPFPVTVILEDAHRLPTMPAFAGAVERGRARKLAHVVTSLSYRSFSRALCANPDELEALFAIQIILPQNDAATISYLQHRLSGVTREDLMRQTRTHLIALQAEPEPIRVRTPFFFMNPWMLDRVYNPRTAKGPRPVTMLSEACA